MGRIIKISVDSLIIKKIKTPTPLKIDYELLGLRRLYHLDKIQV